MLTHIKARPGWDEDGFEAKGFTLVELLVVIVILGILAAVVVFAVAGIDDRGQESACETDRRTLQTAAEAFNAQEDRYPANEAELVSAGFLNEESDLHDLQGSSSQVDPVGDCVGVGD